ncbi:hypothetical protein TRAPUB_3978 [Trametes pubescens]|uniref:Uncharacterized protein n=1 Tax=Trametes pubescens TaxID=154538 RepID=A0A1M2VC82_TRAPU|nr:hypothetical protein TRAPUB_3978 [Trametes pubescens]
MPTTQLSSLDKTSEAGSFDDKGGALNSGKAVGFDSASSEEGNVGLHEFDIAKQSGIQVTPEQNRRYAVERLTR